jgi:hypothetical protein
MTDFASLLAAVPTLTPEQLARLQAAIKAALAVSGDGAAIGTESEPIAAIPDEWLLAGLVDVLNSRGQPVTLAQITRQRGAVARWRAKREGVVRFLMPIRDRTGQLGLFKLGVGLLYDDMRRMGVPPSPMAVLAHLDRLPAVVDIALPGYAAAGLLHLAVRR